MPRPVQSTAVTLHTWPVHVARSRQWSAGSSPYEQIAPSTGHIVPLVGSLDGHAAFVAGTSLTVTSLAGASLTDESFAIASPPPPLSIGTTLPPHAARRDEPNRIAAKKEERMALMILHSNRSRS
jgi:hypothetical protein